MVRGNGQVRVRVGSVYGFGKREEIGLGSGLGVSFRVWVRVQFGV